MNKPNDPGKSWIPGVGQDIHRAGVYGNIIHNVTQDPITKRPVYWFQKVKGQRNQGVAQWLLDVCMSQGEVYIVDYDRDGTTPLAYRRVGSKKPEIPVTREELHQLMSSKGVARQ